MLGNSGCMLEFDFDNKVVIKKCVDSYAKRLYLQALKTKYDSTAISSIKTPKIYSINNNYYSMEYICGKTLIDLAKEQNFKFLQHYKESIIDYIGSNINKCSTEKNVNAILLDKVHSIREFIPIILYEMIVQEIEKEDVFLPIGYCHGDLTFANIIFVDKDIYFIDHLDSFIESPVIDLIKIYQDTLFNWSFFLSGAWSRHIYNWYTEINKELEIFNRFNKPILHAVNIARIFPYSFNNNRTRRYLEICLENVLSSYQFAASPLDFRELDLNGY